MNKLQNFQKKYPKFVYKNYFCKVSKNTIEIFFDFRIGSDIQFSPEITIKNITPAAFSAITAKSPTLFNNLIFHLGLIEMLSYWKATCSPTIEIQAGYLNKAQIKWWQDIIRQGMGQFFYENKINFKQQNFPKIIPVVENSSLPNSLHKTVENSSLPILRENRYLIPMGGGKDSIVTLEILKKTKKDINCFVLNPTETTKKIMKIGGIKNPIIVERKIDKKLLELNRKGYLNGHTPFSAYLAFLSLVCGVVFDYKYIALSNERSSNEGNLKYLDETINHQYSKSFDFEQKFRKYYKKYLIRDIEYFSFLRPLYEIQIAKLFSKYPKYFSDFLSCNEAYKTHSGAKKPFKKWCGNCSKCLFVFTILYPFIGEQKLIKIFKQNLFEKKSLLPIMKELMGDGFDKLTTSGFDKLTRGKVFKPFECVGTKKESLAAFYLSWKKTRDRVSGKLPELLKYFEKNILPKYSKLEAESRKIMNSWNKQHNLPKDIEKIFRKAR